jgi:hypothetical protein
VEFDITLRLAGLPPGPVGVEEFRFDQDHNSYFRLGRQLRDQAIPRALDPGQLVQLQETIRQIEGDSRSEQLKGLKRLAEIGPAAAQAASGPVFRLIQKSPDAAVRGKATELLLGLNAPPAYPAATVRKVEDLATLRATNTTVHRVKDDGRLEVKLRLAGNGANWLSIQRESDP